MDATKKSREEEGKDRKSGLAHLLALQRKPRLPEMTE